MRAASAFTQTADPYRAGLSLGEELAPLEPEVVFLYASIHLGRSPELLSGLHDGLNREHVAVVGSTGDGFYANRGPSEFGATALALNSGDQVRWHVVSARGVQADPAGATRAALAAAQQRLGGRRAALMVLLSDFNTDASEIEKVISTETTVPIVGGLAADDNQMKRCAVFANRELLRDAMVILAAEGEVHFSIHIGNSLAPVGKPGTVEAAEGKTLLRIDGMDAESFVSNATGKPVLQSDRGITSLTIIDAREPHIRRLRSIVPDFTQQQGGLGLYGGIEVGKHVQVCLARPEDLIREVHQIAGRAHAEFPPVAALITSCVGRRWLLGDEIHHEVDALAQEFGTTLPVAGFPSFGEIGPLRTPSGGFTRNLFHNMTYVLLLIGP
ncbi:MAG: FIST N-terminal domain-containing protein [Myxococcota bacterium]